MTLTVDQQAALEKTHVNAAWFLELQFTSGTVRICSYTRTFTWGGYDWTGIGSLGNISPIEESAGIGASAMMFTLAVTQISLLSLALGDSAEYRGLPAALYFCPLDEHGVLIDEPEVCWRGMMDTMGVGVDGEEGQITLKCETSAYGIKRRPMPRINAAQQKQRHPTDTGLNYLNDLIARPQMWLSRKFQQI